jgi:signal transduction histidine kinase
MEMRATRPDIYMNHKGQRVRRMTLAQQAELRKRYVASAPRWRHPLVGYIISFPIVGTALIGTLMLQGTLGHILFPGSLMVLAVLFVALLWGAGPSLLAVVLSTLLLDYYFVHPTGQFSFTTWNGALELIPFIITGFTIAIITAQRERARLNALATEQELQDYAQELEAANQKLADANAMKDRFISIASHELKTPITTIRGQAQLALRRLSKQASPPSDLESVLTSLERINEQTGRLTFLIEELMDVSSIRAGKVRLQKQKYDLNDICREVVEDQRLLTGRSITLEVPPKPVKVQVDNDRLSQVLVNLISNAVKYSPESSPVEVYVRNGGQSALIEVRDCGKGIPKNQQDLIFETFYRTPDAQSSSKQGLGLGLAISKEIVERHNGRIWVESEPDQGSTFFVELPLK